MQKWEGRLSPFVSGFLKVLSREIVAKEQNFRWLRPETNANLRDIHIYLSAPPPPLLRQPCR